MNLVQIAVLALLAAALGRLKTGRHLALLASSTLVLFWLQPPEPIASLTFWLPVGTLALTLGCWLITAPVEKRSWGDSWPALSVILAAVLLVVVGPGFAMRLNPSLAVPSLPRVLLIAISIGALLALLWRWKAAAGALIPLAIALILVVFVIIKSPQALSEGLKWLSSLGVSPAAAERLPLAWLGYSYVAFRLLHTLRDKQAGRLPALALGEYVNYVIFFPAFAAGPIDRVQRFVSDLRTPLPLTNTDWVETGTRLLVGLFKKLVLADLLAVIAFNDLLVKNIQRPGWMWLFLYAYAFRIFLDFSGYTDIAIALGRMLGVRLPENFAAPYLKSNISLFWNSWHMSLTQWFRAYVFNPLARRLRTPPTRLPELGAVLLTQLVTMLLIGLWHGITWNFALWGLWHGVGLFIHYCWAGFARWRWPNLTPSRAMSRLSAAGGVLLTFNFVALGWLLFGLSTPQLAWRAIGLLFGKG